MHDRQFHQIGLFPKLNAELSELVSGALDDTVIGVSIFLKDPASDAVFAVSNLASNRAFVADRVDRRLLTPDQSIASAVMESGKAGAIINAGSIMCPEHSCLHFVSPDKKALLQIARSADMARTPLRQEDFILMNAQASLAGYDKVADFFGPEIKQAFQARAAYKPNRIIMLCDVSGYTDMVNNIGCRAADRFMNQFYNETVLDLCSSHHASILRAPEGDDCWLGFDCSDGKDLKSVLNKCALPMANDLIEGYRDIKQRSGQPDYPLRISVAFGEVSSNVVGTHIKYQGSVFITARQLNENAPRGNDCIAIDPEAKALTSVRYLKKMQRDNPSLQIL